MNGMYEPSSDFLNAMAAGNVPLSGSDFAEANLERLIATTRDEDSTNRDWATFLLSLSDIDTPAVRGALLCAAGDDNEYVRAGATWGLARRDRDLALPLVREALSADAVAATVFEAAALLAHPSLIENLRRWTTPSGDAYADGIAASALAACETGVPQDL